MNCKLNTVIEVTLTMAADEALWLKQMTQNYIGPGNEVEEDRRVRVTLFEALPPFKELTEACRVQQIIES